MSESVTATALRHLGSGHTDYPTAYDPGLLEWFANPRTGVPLDVELVCPEFTSLCPKTNQPDFGAVTISYRPRERMVESKSLKLYLFSFRNHGSFHEACIATICADLAELLEPQSITVEGRFNPRGGIAINPTARVVHRSLQAGRPGGGL